jgi:hypothetical protein
MRLRIAVGTLAMLLLALETRASAAFASNDVGKRLSFNDVSVLQPTVNSWGNQPLASPNYRNTRIYIFRSNKSHHMATEEDGEAEKSSLNGDSSEAGSRKIRKRVKDLARNLVGRPLSLASNVPMPQAIAAVLREASLAAVERVDEVIHRNEKNNTGQALQESKELMTTVIEEAFAPMEASLTEMEASLVNARMALKSAKSQSMQAIEAIQVAAIAQASGAAEAVAQAEKVAERQVMAEIYSNAVTDVDVSLLSFDDVDYESSEMAPPFLDPDSCLIPGEPVCRVEKAPENSRRIFAGIDVMASVDDVWKVRF